MIAASLHRRLRSTVALLPRGRMLPAEVWRRRHQVIVRLAVAQALALLVFGLARGLPISEAALGAAAVAAPLLAALPAHFSRGVRSTATSVSLFLASTVLVHFWGGQTEAHFHFFVMVGVVALYQDWLPFGVGLAIVVVHHGVLGTLQPHQVFSHHEAMAHPWSWAAVHAGFVLAASVAHLTSWRLNEHQGLHDPLTGLANRTLLREGLTRSLARGLPVSVVLIDLDDFKDVNDSRGHAAGDRLLLAVAERLDASARGAGEIARLGGDEFAVSVPAGAEAARRVGERFVAGLAQPVHVDGRQLSVHASIGVADSATLSGPASPGPCHAAARADELLRNADLALHRAKAGGKNRVVGYATTMAQAAHERVALLQDLAQALPEDQLEVHYQATIEFGTGTTTGYEALLRWRHPVRGLVPPLDFVPLAETSGDILDIGAWVLRTATRQAARWSCERGAAVTIAVNLSPVQLAGDDVVDVVATALADSGLPPGQLTLEVTESVLVADLDAVSARLSTLRESGVRIAIDDFGTGYSSLAYLRRLPVDTVKIDRSFVGDLALGGSATTLVATIVELARSLGLEVVAEGVETDQQAAVLRELSCTYAQGFLYARPEAAEDVPDPAATGISA